MLKRLSFKSTICALLVLVLSLPSLAFASSETKHHWASDALQKWESYGVIDSDHNPNQALTRIEVIEIINKLFGFTTVGTASYTDVDPSSSIGKQIVIASNAGYMSGYSDQSFRPDQPVTRAEIAVILFRLFQLKAEHQSNIEMKDASAIRNWSKDAITALLNDRYMNGYPDKTFKPNRNVTLAELVSILNNIVPVVITEPGQYTGINASNIIIASEGVSLSNSIISGNVYIASNIRNATFSNVSVLGTFFSYFSQEHFTFENSSINQFNQLALLENNPQEPSPSATPAPSSNPVPNATPTPTRKPNPTNSPVPTASPEPTASSEPSASPEPTASSEPSASPEPTASSEPSASPEPTASSEPSASPEPTASFEPSASPEPTSAPVFSEVSVHDPSIIKADGTYYVFGSHIDAAQSTDLMNWSTFTNGYTPNNNAIFGDLVNNLAPSFKWAGMNDADSTGGFSVWAPDVMWVDEYVNEDGTTGAYLMYYSVSSTYIRSAIGIAASKDIEGPYVYVDTIIYSGFTRDEAYDDKSTINKKWDNTNISDLIADGTLKGERSGWFNSSGNYNNSTFPNAIDANLYRSPDDKLYMSYGSWSGGIFVLEIDPSTGLPIYPGADSTTADGRLVDRYFGTKIAGGYGKSGEGPYVVYDPESQYYYLFVTYGWLGIDGEYNMRVFRSETPNGPFVDALDQSAVLPSNISNEPYGNKIMGHYLLERNIGEAGSGNGIQYVSPGHNSVYIDPETGERFVIFHTRFSQQVDGHQLRIHQLVMNEDGWLISTPYRYTGETLQLVNEQQIIGEYKYLNHEKDSSKTVHTSDYIQLHEDHTISGAVTGTWELINDYTAHITINNKLYKGVFLTQWDSASEDYVMTFTAMNDEGKSIWGSMLDSVTAQNILDDLTITPMNNIISDLSLPTVATRHIAIDWSSSDSSIITDQGVVTRPYSNNDSNSVTLTASIIVDEVVYTKQFNVTVKPIESAKIRAHYSFNDSLTDTENSSMEGVVVGSNINETGGSISYSTGISDKAAYFNGSSGVLLPNNLIASDTYSVSMWLKPEELTSFTTAFFAAQDSTHWFSLLPKGNAVNNTMLWHRFESTDTWFDVKSNITISLHDWSHVAFTVEEGFINLYINGVKYFSAQGIADLFSDGDSIFSLAVNYWDIPYKGYIDELQIYDGILSQQEITDMQITNALVTDIILPSSEQIVSVGKTFTPASVSIVPNAATNKTLTWSSSDPTIATVDATTGTVSTLAEGQTTITAKATDGGNVSSSYTLYVVNGAIAHFTFDETLSNNAVAGSKSAQYIGSKIGIATSDSANYGAAISNEGIVLDGEHGVLLPNYYFNSNEYTISFHTKLNQLSNYTPLFFAAQVNNEWLSFVPGGAEHTSNTAYIWSNYNNGVNWFDGVSGQLFPANEWVHVTITVNNGTAKLYYDGALIKTFTNFPNLYTTGTSTVALGVNYWDIPANGIVDELLIYDYTLSDEEVASLSPAL